VIVHCVICRKPFEAKRSTAKYCSDAHRVLAQRRGLAGVNNPDILEAWRVSEEGIRIVRQKIAALNRRRDARLDQIERDTSLNAEDKRLRKERVVEKYWRARLQVEPGDPPPGFKLPPDWQSTKLPKDWENWLDAAQ
jgi:hypothetical protein